ncbi:MAG: MFS transporter, partial [Pseudomonadota bacterium]
MSYVQFLTQNARWLAGGFLLTFFSSFGQTFFISLSGGAIRTEYDLTNGEWGTLYMLATLGSAMTLPFLGRIVDHVSVAKTVLITVPALVLATFLMSVSHSIILLVVILYALRLFGQGMMTHISITAMGRWYSA